jgi:predicted nuclease of predicted toxin-antitoxin system
MRFLANENVPGPVVRKLRELLHDVLWAKEDLRGKADHEVLSRAQAEQRVVSHAWIKSLSSLQVVEIENPNVWLHATNGARRLLFGW